MLPHHERMGPNACWADAVTVYLRAVNNVYQPPSLAHAILYFSPPQIYPTITESIYLPIRMIGFVFI